MSQSQKIKKFTINIKKQKQEFNESTTWVYIANKNSRRKHNEKMKKFRI